MDLLSPLRLGLHVTTEVTTGAVKLATFVPRLILHELVGDDDEQRFHPTSNGGERPVATRPVERARPAPEPTSAAGASGGVAGTAAAEGAAAAVSAPDPTAASATEPADTTAPQGARRENDVRPPRATRVRKRTEPKRSEIDRRRVEQRESGPTEEEVTLAETEGAATPAATLRVDEPWDGYGAMKATEIVTRVKSSDDATKAVVRLYEQTHKKRKSILDATG